MHFLVRFLQGIHFFLLNWRPLALTIEQSGCEHHCFSVPDGLHFQEAEFGGGRVEGGASAGTGRAALGAGVGGELLQGTEVMRGRNHVAIGPPTVAERTQKTAQRFACNQTTIFCFIYPCNTVDY